MFLFPIYYLIYRFAMITSSLSRGVRRIIERGVVFKGWIFKMAGQIWSHFYIKVVWKDINFSPKRVGRTMLPSPLYLRPFLSILPTQISHYIFLTVLLLYFSWLHFLYDTSDIVWEAFTCELCAFPWISMCNSGTQMNGMFHWMQELAHCRNGSKEMDE